MTIYFISSCHVETIVSLGLGKSDRKYMYIDYKPDHHTIK